VLVARNFFCSSGYYHALVDQRIIKVLLIVDKLEVFEDLTVVQEPEPLLANVVLPDVVDGV
jgi:hypothetical protein